MNAEYWYGPMQYCMKKGGANRIKSIDIPKAKLKRI